MNTTPRSAVVESGRVSLAPRAETPKNRELAMVPPVCPRSGAAEGESGMLGCRCVSRKETLSRRFTVLVPCIFGWDRPGGCSR